jgi:hypothetical protein
MTVVSPTQSNPNDEIKASSINDPINQIATVINGNLDNTNINSLSGAKIQAGTVPATAMTTDSNPETRMSESLGNFVASGGVWSQSSGLVGTMTAGVVYIGGKRVTVAAVATKTFTASKDTYVSVDNGGAISYQEVANNAAVPTLPANSVWLAKVVSAAAITSVADLRITAPGVGGVATTATVLTTETTGSATYTDLATVGPTVTTVIGPKGAAVVTVTCHSYNSAVNDTFMSFTASGANTIAADDSNAKATSTTSGQTASTVTTLTGLTPGVTTFTAKYRVAAGTGGYLRRKISVVPL